jgi:hypothetical protein
MVHRRSLEATNDRQLYTMTESAISGAREHYSGADHPGQVVELPADTGQPAAWASVLLALGA